MAVEGASQPIPRTPSTEPLQYVDDSELLSVTAQQADRALLVIHVAGEVDMLTGPALQDQISNFLAIQPERLIIDLSQVSFLGSNGLQVLVNARKVAAEQGTTLQLSGTSPRAVARPLEVTGLSHLFEILPPAVKQR